MGQSDLDALRAFVLRIARQLLRKAGDFDPFAASMSQSGIPAVIVVASGPELPHRDAWITSLQTALRRETTAMQLRAVAICSAEYVALAGHESIPAVRVRLEHRGGDAADMFIPHRKGWCGLVKYGDVTECPGTLEVFKKRAV